MSYNGVLVKHIVATDLNGCIGKDGKMPWHISEDLKRFRELTEGGVVIMGRKTFESLGCKPLPNRRNIVVSRKFDFYNEHKDSGATILGTLQGALRSAVYAAHSTKVIWIIGGAQIYEQTMQYVDVIEETVVDMRVDGGDAFYPKKNRPALSSKVSDIMVDKKSGVGYFYASYGAQYD